MARSDDKAPAGIFSSARPSALIIVPPAVPIIFVTGLPMGVPMDVMAAEVSLFPVELFPVKLFPVELIPVKLVFTQLLMSAAKSMMVKRRSIY